MERCQEDIESAGFEQLISTITRSWSGQSDSILDHIWVNCRMHIINHFNSPRGPSDHNVVGINISTKQIKMGEQNILRRKWCNFVASRFIEKLRRVDWKDLYSEVNPDVASSMLEEIIEGVLDTEAPHGGDTAAF